MRARGKRKRDQRREADTPCGCVSPVSGYLPLALACAAFVGSHFLLSHPLRAGLVERLGARPFQGVYSLVAFITFGAMIYAYLHAPASKFHWGVGNRTWIVATVLMWLASVLLAGSFSSNPALPDPRARVNANKPAQGVFAITRHPMMWSLILWAIVHIAVLPTTANFWLSGSILFLAFFGALGQDAKKARAMGLDWQGWQGRTAFLPFGMQLTGKSAWSDAIPGFGVLLGGTMIWLVATWAHGGIGAGIWRWV